MSHSKSRFNSPIILVCLFLVFSTFAIYWPVWEQDFINLDDDIYVTENVHVQSGLTPEGVKWAFTNIDQSKFWLPLTWLSLMLDNDLYGMKAGGYKFTNVLLHIANTLLLFMVLNGMTGKLWRSAFVAALFALHPLHVESVAWVTERKDVLSSFFWLLTIWGYLRYLEHPKIRRYFLVTLFFVLGLMAKPMLVSLPFALLMLDYWPLNRFILPCNESSGKAPSHPDIHQIKKNDRPLNLVWEKLPLVALAAGASVVTIFTQVKGGSAAPLVLPVMFRIYNALVSYVSYIWKTLLPLSLGVFYPHPVGSLPMWKVSVAALLLVAITIGAWRSRRQKPYLLFGWLWYLVTLLPAIGLVQVGTQAMADRFSYMPSIGLFVIISWGIHDLLSRWRYKQRALALMAGVSIMVMIFLSSIQLQFWQNSITLFKHTLAVTTDNWIIENNLGATFMQKLMIDEATIHFNEALKINPSLHQTHHSLGVILRKQGNLQKATEHFYEAVRYRPDFAEAHNDLGASLLQQGLLQNAVTHFSEALKIEPDYPDAHNNLGLCYLRMQMFQKAAEHFSKLVQIRPDSAKAHNLLGVAFAEQDKLEDAARHFSEALKINPDFSDAQKNLNVIAPANHNEPLP